MPLFEVGIDKVLSATMFIVADTAEEAHKIAKESVECSSIMHDVFDGVSRDYADYKVYYEGEADMSDLSDDDKVIKDGEVVWACDLTED